MKTTKFLTILFLAFSTLFFNSCKDDDITIPVDTHEDAYVDVILKKTKTPTGYKYNVITFAGATSISTTDCTVTYPSGETFILPELTWQPGTLNHVSADYPSTTVPTAGTYTFTLKFTDGYVKTLTDVMETTELSFPVFDFTYDNTSTPNKIIINWTDVDPNSDLICVKLVDAVGNTKPYFKIAKLPTTTASGSYTINFDGGTGWLRPVSDLVTGTTYHLAVVPKKVEAGKPIDGASKDFQTTSCVRKPIVR